jgi:hypothetical protein
MQRGTRSASWSGKSYTTMERQTKTANWQKVTTYVTTAQGRRMRKGQWRGQIKSYNIVIKSDHKEMQTKTIMQSLKLNSRNRHRNILEIEKSNETSEGINNYSNKDKFEK